MQDDKCRRKTGEAAGEEGDGQRKDRHWHINGDGSEARDRLCGGIERSMDGHGRAAQAQHTAGHAQEQTFQYDFAQQRAGARAQRQPNGIFAMVANGPNQHENRDVDARDEQDH